MLATHYSRTLSESFETPPTYKEDYGSLVRTTTSVHSNRVESSGFVETKTILGERNTNVDHQNGQPEDQEGSLNETRKRHSEATIASLQHQQQQQVPLEGEEENREQEELDEREKVNRDRQPKQLQPVEDGDKKKEYKLELVWTNVIAFVILHASLPFAIYFIYAQQPWLTVAFSILGAHLSMVGALAGGHRLYSHRSYRAKWPVQVVLLVFHTMAGQNSAYTWARDHRMHHKYSETDADPHNIERGLFFAHMGWLCCKKHPEVREKGKLIDMSDLKSNPYVMFQHRNFWLMSIVFAVLVPTMIPVLCWGEQFWTSFVLSFMFRYLLTLHWTWLLNSYAHYHGPRPYDTNIGARQYSPLIISGIGEGAHNYHHTFPYDYKNSEYGRHYNFPAAFIDFCAYLGLVDGRRRVSAETLTKRRQRTGDWAKENSKEVLSELDDAAAYETDL